MFLPSRLAATPQTLPVRGVAYQRLNYALPFERIAAR